MNEIRQEELHSDVVVKKRAKVIAVQRSFVSALVFFAVIGYMLMLWSAIEGHLVRNRLVDCIDPQGECFAESKRTTAKAITQISNDTIEGAIPLHMTTRTYILLAAACAEPPGIQTYKEIEKCVMDALPKEEE